MSGINPHKLSDAVPKSDGHQEDPKGDKPSPTAHDAAEQARLAHEREVARNAEASIRDHMVDIGRGNQQAGRQKPGRSG